MKEKKAPEQAQSRTSATVTPQTFLGKAGARYKDYLLRNPDRLKAVRVSAVIAVLFVPFILLGKPFFGVSLALGALAGALSETDDHPKGRLEALLVKTIAFFIASMGVELACSSPLLMIAGMGVSTVICILVGGVSERYRGIMFGTLLVALYTMIGAANKPTSFIQPILLPTGAFVYGLFSLWLLRRNQWRLLDEQLARGFSSLGDYFTTKARLFPADKADQRTTRNSLAVINQQIVAQLDGCRGLINTYRDYDGESRNLRFYLQGFMLLQGLHERAASSHQRYDSLSDELTHGELIEGIGAATAQIGMAIHQLGESLLSGRPFRYPSVLDWLIAGLRTELQRQHIPTDHPLHFLIANLSSSAVALYNMEDERTRHLAPRLARDSRSRWQCFADQLSWENGRMRFAVRLAICFVAGLTVAELLDIAKGEWIVLTSLFVCQPTYGETRRKIPKRIVGTLLGVIVGSLLLQLLPTQAGKTVLLITSCYAFFLWLRRDYHIAVIFVTIVVLCAFDLMSGNGTAIMLPRLLDTVIGSGLALLSVRLLWPEWQYKRLPVLLRDALGKNSAYLAVILEEYRQGPTALDDDLEYRIARRQAHRADAALVVAWRDMQVEPRKFQTFSEQAYRFTHLNHALLSFISAFGAHKVKHAEFEACLDTLAKEVLQFLEQTATGSVESTATQRRQLTERGAALLCSINDNMQTSRQDQTTQQFLLLRNICELTIAIIDRSEFLSEMESPVSSGD